MIGKGTQAALDMYRCAEDVVFDKEKIRDILEEAADRFSLKELALYATENDEGTTSALSCCAPTAISSSMYSLPYGYVEADIFTLESGANPETGGGFPPAGIRSGSVQAHHPEAGGLRFHQGHETPAEKDGEDHATGQERRGQTEEIHDLEKHQRIGWKTRGSRWRLLFLTIKGRTTMKYICWDIDGTLLLTNYAGVAAMKSTIIDLYGLDNFEFTYGMAGRTDTYIARKAIEGIQGRCTPEEVTRMLQAYGKKLPASLVEKQGHLLPHVKETLEWIRQDPDTTSLLLTGNCEVAAHAKLAYFGIEEEFDYSRSAFGEISELRDDLSQALWDRVRKTDPGVTRDHLVVIGDTPHDITCAQAIGVRSLIVLKGSAYAPDRLEAYHPWKIIPELPEDPRDLNAILEED